MQNIYCASIDNIIALCNILDNFLEFERKLEDYNRLSFELDLYSVTMGKRKKSEAHKFYVENMVIMNTILKYTNLMSFFAELHTGNLHFFYDYIVSHKSDLDKTLSILERLKELGFLIFNFDELLDSNYELHLDLENHTSYNNFIVLKSLIFDPNELPSYLNNSLRVKRLKKNE